MLVKPLQFFQQVGRLLYPFGTPFDLLYGFANVVPTIKNFSKKLPKIISFTYITTYEYGENI